MKGVSSLSHKGYESFIIINSTILIEIKDAWSLLFKVLNFKSLNRVSIHEIIISCKLSTFGITYTQQLI